MKHKWALTPAKIIEYIKANHAYKIRRDGEEYVISNPINGDTGFHFNINPKKGVCHDWRGDESWAGPENPKSGKRNVSFLNFVRIHKKCSIEQAYKIVMGNSVTEINAIQKGVETLESDIKLPNGSQPLNADSGPLAILIIIWLAKRGYSEEDVISQDIHFFGNDVIWPYFEYGEMVYWQSRSFINKVFRFPDRNIYENGKVIGVSSVSKGDFLYGFDEVSHQGRCYITESIFDKNSIGPMALASGGAILTENQCRKLRLTGANEVILTPDNDKAGLKSIVANHNKLSPFFKNIYYCVPPIKCDGKDIKDWNEMITEAKLCRQDISKYIDNNMIRLDDRAILRLRLKTR